MRQRYQLYGITLVLMLVLSAIVILQKAGRPPSARPVLENVPELGQVPTREQIENRPPMNGEAR